VRWRRVDSPDVIDRRGGGGGGGGGGLPIPLGRAGGGVGLIAVLVFLAVQLLGGGSGGSAFDVPTGFDEGVRSPGGQAIPRSQDPDRDLRDFSAYVFTTAQKSWEQTFRRAGRPYEHAKLVLYSSGVSTGCGSASSAVGPFYCPADQRVYLDLSFYREMASSLQASGDFAWAYVIAHELGHHVQRLAGTSDKVRRLQQDDSGQTNALSVRLELQADCYAGVWASSVFRAGDLQEGDLDEAFGAAQAVGDDRLQRRARGSIDPDTFTHGTSEQRKHWFRTGYEAAKPEACDTFSADQV
jgi:predicted metalloprotease